MPSIAYRHWRPTRARALDEIVQAHVSVGGTKRGRRYATQQINRAYAVLLVSQFQGFCRELHNECINSVVATMTPLIQAVVWNEMTRGRQLDRGNAQPATLGADFGRLGLDLWPEMTGLDPRSNSRQMMLEELNAWRNAIAHQDFDPARLGGATILRLAQIRRWRAACHSLARTINEVTRSHLQQLTGVSPW
jgi:hypothetical protein